MMEKPKPDDDEAVEPVEYIENDYPDLMRFIDWVFFAGVPLGEPEEESEEGDTDEEDLSGERLMPHL